MARPRTWKGIRLFTVGHSTRSLEELVELLSAFDVSIVVDIRTVPRSRRNPQYSVDVLPSTLAERKLSYMHLPELGGLRRARKDSANTAWRNASFRGYADYMATADFQTGLTKLRALAEKETAVIMCAEAVPWRCHRSLVADAITVCGGEVAHIMGPKRAQAHRLTPFARVEGTKVTYPGDEETTIETPARPKVTTPATRQKREKFPKAGREPKARPKPIARPKARKLAK